MQHHTHLTRPPHMRSAHTNNIQIHPAPVLTQPPTQLPQKLAQPPPTVLAQPSNMRDHQSRVNKSQTSTTLRNQTTQMQKIRQQHQNLSYKNNNNHYNSNSNNNNNNYQQYNNINVPQQQDQQTHMGVLQQHQQQQPQHQIVHRHVPSMHHQQKQHQQQQQQYNVLQVKNPLPQQQTQQHHLPQTNTAVLVNQQGQQPQQFQQYPYVNNKSKYSSNKNINNNNNTITQTTTNYSTPKSILQNPNRLVTKPSNQALPASTLVTTTGKETVANDLSSSVRSGGENNSSSISNEIPIQSQNQTQSSDHHEVQVQENMVNITDTVPSNEANKENISCEDQAMVSSAGDSSNQLQNSLLSNVDVAVTKHTKEKTPMCLVNELARFNKITHQYRLTGEKGPAHCKRFTVTLKLGDEEYTAEGFKIKKAQHLAAAQAIEKTAYKHPIPKANRNCEEGKQRPYIMPTVELNALAMKLGQQTYYLLDPRQMPPSMPPASGSEIMDVMHDGSGIPTHHYGPRPPMPPPTGAHTVGHIMPPPQPHPRMMHDLTYGPRRTYDVHGGIYPPPPPPPPLPHMHHPSQRSYLPHRGYQPMNRYHQRYPLLPPPPPPGMPPAPHHMHPHFGVPTTPYKITLIVGKQKFVGVGRTLQQAKHDAAARALQVLKAKAEEKFEDELDESVDESDSKSPISQVHEAAIKRGMQVHFKILREEGPAHMRNFITACIVGSIVTEGEGHGKKISKKRAAEKMLVELKKLPPVTPVKSPSKRIKVKTPAKINSTQNSKISATPGSVGRRGKRDAVIVKSKEKEKGEDDDENPITKLIQIQQNRKEKEPVFEFLAKSGNDRLRRREFIVEVTAQGIAARGTGKNKKLAKRNAAENLLNALAEAAQNKIGETVPHDTTDNGANTSPISQSEPRTTPVKATENVQRIPNTLQNESFYSGMNVVNGPEIPKVATSAGQIPGVLILRQNKRSASKKKETTVGVPSGKSNENEASEKEIPVSENTTKVSDVPPASISENVAATAAPVVQKTVATTVSTSSVTSTSSCNALTTSATATDTTTSSKSSASTSNNKSSTSSSSATPIMKHQLLYLANLFGFEVDFSDFPKGNHNELLTIVTLSTDPPQICHGFGSSTNESQNDAARNALKILSDLGLNNAKSN